MTPCFPCSIASSSSNLDTVTSSPGSLAISYLCRRTVRPSMSALYVCLLASSFFLSTPNAFPSPSSISHISLFPCLASYTMSFASVDLVRKLCFYWGTASLLSALLHCACSYTRLISSCLTFISLSLVSPVCALCGSQQFNGISLWKCTILYQNTRS